MDRRIIFLAVFVITLFSTLTVGAVSYFVGQSWLRTVLFSLATMWIVGILSQVLITNLYHVVVRPMEEEKRTDERLQRQEDLNLQDVEEIDQAAQILREASVKDKERRAQEKSQLGI